MRKTAVQKYFSENVLYGGLLATRAEVYEDSFEAAAVRGNLSQRDAHRIADQNSGRLEAFTGDTAYYEGHGLTLKAIRAKEGE